MRRNSVAFQIRQIGGYLALIFAIFAGAPHRCAAQSLQSFVSHLVSAKAGAVIVSDPRTGRILALVNQQGAFQQAYTPGSTAKLVVSAAALEEGIISPSDRIMCRRIPRLLGDAFHCSHPPAAHPFDLAEALANSCNYFFAEVGARLSSPRWRTGMRSLVSALPEKMLPPVKCAFRISPGKESSRPSARKV